MTSKKIAATLGTGTLGAGGAAGVAAWKLGSSDDRSLNVDSSGPSPAQSEPQIAPTTEHGAGANGNSGDRRESTPKIYFANATTFDKKAVDSNNWETVEEKRDGVTIKVTEGSDTWQCTIKGVVFENDQSKKQSVNNQVKEFVNQIKDDETKRKKFVEKCAKARLNAENTEGGKKSTIELEVEDSGGNTKLKDLDKLLEDDFVSLKRLEEEYGDILGGSEVSIIIDPNWDKVNKKMSLDIKRPAPNSSIICSISGKIEDSDFKNLDFNDEPLGGIFISESDSEETEDDKYTKNEKKKFLFRNCLNKKGKIENMEVVSYTDENSAKKWKFKNLGEMLTKIYWRPES